MSDANDTARTPRSPGLGSEAVREIERWQGRRAEQKRGVPTVAELDEMDADDYYGDADLDDESYEPDWEADANRGGGRQATACSPSPPRPLPLF